MPDVSFWLPWVEDVDILSPTRTQYTMGNAGKERKHNKAVIWGHFHGGWSPINAFIAVLMKITVTKDLIMHQILIQTPVFLGFLWLKKKKIISSVVHLTVDLTPFHPCNTSWWKRLLELIWIRGATVTSEQISHFSHQLRVWCRQVGYLELQTEICRAASASCKKCFLHFLPLFLLWMSHQRMRPKSTFVLLKDSY